MAIEAGPGKTPRHFMGGVIFFIIVIIITSIIFFYKTGVASTNNNTISEIDSLEKIITETRKDQDIQAYELYDKNSKTLDEMTYLSNIPMFYDSIVKMGKDYNLEFSKFGYSKGIVTVQAIADSDSNDEAYQKLEEFIGNFRMTEEQTIDDGEKEGDESLFELDFIESFKGANRISSNMNFLVKPEPQKKEEIEKVQETKEVEKTGTGTINAGNDIKKEVADEEKEKKTIEAAIKQ